MLWFASGKYFRLVIYVGFAEFQQWPDVEEYQKNKTQQSNQTAKHDFHIKLQRRKIWQRQEYLGSLFQIFDFFRLANLINMRSDGSLLTIFCKFVFSKIIQQPNAVFIRCAGMIGVFKEILRWSKFFNCATTPYLEWWIFSGFYTGYNTCAGQTKICQQNVFCSSSQMTQKYICRNCAKNNKGSYIHIVKINFCYMRLVHLFLEYYFAYTHCIGVRTLKHVAFISVHVSRRIFLFSHVFIPKTGANFLETSFIFPMHS